MATDNSIQVRLEDVRLSFPALWVPEAPPAKGGKPQDKKAYQAQFLMPVNSPQFKQVSDAIVQVSKNQWGANAEAIRAKLKTENRICFRDGNLKTSADGDILDGYAGNYFLSARSYTRPTIVNVDRSPLTADDGKPYSGCQVNAIVRIWPQAGGQFGLRINCQLMGVQFLRDGESFGGGRPADPEEFDALGEFADGDPNVADLIGGGLDDDVPF